MSVFIGVDGGGSHARAVVVDDGGHELARVEGGAGLVDPRQPDAAAAVVAQLARATLDAADAAPPAAALCCGLAGAGRQPERDAVGAALARTRIAERILVVGDAEAAAADAFGNGDGVLLIAGTGSIAWARHGPDVLRVGGWGALLGDEGSGYDLGLRALRAVARAHDGRADATSLTAAVLRHCGVATPPELISWTARAAKRDIAALAPVLLHCAATDQDAAAGAIRSRAVDDLCTLAAAATARARLAAPDIAVTGGVTRDPEFRRLLINSLRTRIAGARVHEQLIDAARGAALLARVQLY